MRTTLVGVMALVGSGPGLAQEMVGDPAAGQAFFGQQCMGCHAVKNEAGRVLFGMPGRTAPNLYGVAGRVPGSLPDVLYSDHLVAYGEAGAVWEEANFVPFVLDPSGFLGDVLGVEPDPTPISLMPTGSVREEQQAHDLWAWLVTLSPAASNGAGGETGAADSSDDEPASD